jgi:hypothetical protein
MTTKPAWRKNSIIPADWAGKMSDKDKFNLKLGCFKDFPQILR